MSRNSQSPTRARLIATTGCSVRVNAVPKFVLWIGSWSGEGHADVATASLISPLATAENVGELRRLLYIVCANSSGDAAVRLAGTLATKALASLSPLGGDQSMSVATGPRQSSRIRESSGSAKRKRVGGSTGFEKADLNVWSATWPARRTS